MQYYSAYTTSKWGDSVRILISGLASYLPRSEGRIRLLRTGPYVPRISIGSMGQVIVTEDQTEWLRSISGVLGFRPVIIEKIVRFGWDGSSEPVLSPRMERGEPEDYLIHGKHNPAAAQVVGSLFELLLDDDGEVTSDFNAFGKLEARFTIAPTKNLLLFNATTPGGYHDPIFSESFIQKYEDALKWIEFTKVE